uniref:Salivary lipocalin group II n=1 Tax=Hyalomma rufipes TaxID=72862 RepID=E2J6S3_HYARU
MNCILLAFIFQTCVLAGAAKKNRTKPTLETLRDFLNTRDTIFIYSASAPQYDYDDLMKDEILGDIGDEKCTQYTPTKLGEDNYTLQMTFMLGSAWKNKTVYAALGQNKHGRPYMDESKTLGGYGTEHFLKAYDAAVGCAFFKYVYSTNGFYCETHVLASKVKSYHRRNGDICRYLTRRTCGNVTVTYNVNCSPQC